MLLFEMEGLVGVLILLFWVYCIFDVISTDESLCRSLPKTMWLVLVIILPSVGGLAWLLLGRPERAGFRPGDTSYRRPASHSADDDPTFGRSMYAPAVSGPGPKELAAQRAAKENEEADRKLDEWEADLARREAAAEASQREAALMRREEELRRIETADDDAAG